MTAELREKLFAVIRAGMDAETEALSLTGAEGAELLRIGARQSVQPILYRGLKRLNAPESILRAFKPDRLKETYRIVQRDHALQTVCDALDGGEIPYVLLKGAVLRNLYPAPELRTSSDIDVLVREETLEKACGTLEAETDFKTQKRDYHDISMIGSNTHLELHFSILENAENIDRLLRRAWEYAEATGEGSRYAFTPEYQIFHVIAHMSHHFVHGGLGIRPFLDLWLLRNKTVFEEQTVRQMCAECGILTFYEACCALCRVWMERAAHTETTEMLEEFCLSGGVFGSAQFGNAGRQRAKRGWKYIFSRVFPPASQVKEYYRDRTGKEHTLAYFYAKRLVSWFGRNRRAEMKKQLSDILSSDRDYQDSADELFRRLGL